jgi:hypothetical protein
MQPVKGALNRKWEVGKLRSGVNWKGVLKGKKGVKQKGVKQGLGVFY